MKQLIHMATGVHKTISKHDRQVGRQTGGFLVVLLTASTLLIATTQASAAAGNRKLNPTLADGKGAVAGASRYVDNPFRISPDSSRVVYLADQETDEVFELWSVPITGGEAIKLNAPLPAGGQVSGSNSEVDHPFLISPDNRRVVYLADQETHNVFELWSVPLTGGKPTKLNTTLAGGKGDVRGPDEELPHPFLISADSQHVVYVADQDVDEVFELYSVPITGGAVTKLNPSLAKGRGGVQGDIQAGPEHPFLISPDSQRVVYVADQDVDELYELYSVPITGGEAIQLSRNRAAGPGDVHGGIARPFRISPDSQRVVYVADLDVDEVIELYSVPISGGPVSKLNSTLAGGRGDVQGVDPAAEAFLVSPDSQYVVYLADQDIDEVTELYSVPISGGKPTKLNPPLAGGRGDVRGAGKKVAHPFRISPDSRRVVYIADQETDEAFELWSVAINGGPVSKLNPPMAGGKGDIRGPSRDMINPFRISPDSRRVVYIADQESDSTFELFSVPITGGSATKLNPTLAHGRGEIRGADNIVANPFLITADSTRVVYLADQELVGVMELYSVPIGGGPVTNLNPTLAENQGAILGTEYELHNPFRISPDGRHVVYLADQETDEHIELFASDLPAAAGGK